MDWLRSYITPLFKKGPRTDPGNYRPIALTATMCKIMESIIKDQLLSFLLDKGIINKNQHGFISKHSTCTNLLQCAHDWLVALNSKHTTDIVYIDFSRAFDSIVHNKLLYKLESYGKPAKYLNGLICSFVIDINVLQLKIVFHLLPKLSVVYRKAQFWALFFSYYSLMTLIVYVMVKQI